MYPSDEPALPEMLPRTISIHHGQTLFISDTAGQIVGSKPTGLFFRDTRFVSRYRFALDGLPFLPRIVITPNYYSLKIELDSRKADGSPGPLTLALEREMGEGSVSDVFTLSNKNDRQFEGRLCLQIESDFIDLFAWRGLFAIGGGDIETEWHPEERTLVNKYSWRDFSAASYYMLATPSIDVKFEKDWLVLPVSLAPSSSLQINTAIICELSNQSASAKTGAPAFSGSLAGVKKRWQEAVTGIASSNRQVEETMQAASNALASLRLYHRDLPEDIWSPAAGSPFFLTLFGRDSPITSLETMLLYPGFALATLDQLGRFQGRHQDERRLEEPGKIMHEIRHGPLAVNREIPHTPYYGSIDATLLYPVLLHEAWRWTGDNRLLDRYLPNAEACLLWAETFGDHDGDGFVDYWQFVPRGLKDQGWKDSGNGIVFPDGRTVPNPIALCEFQGYLYDARLRLAEIYDFLGRDDKGDELRSKASDLQAHFLESFWMADEGFIALGVGPEGEVIRTIASNAGHCLWSGIVYSEYSQQVVERLLAPDMFSGWGIRTLSSLNPAFNPLDYHTGTIWPHDNAIIAAGIKRYGFSDQANRVAGAIFAAASFFEGRNIPELFGGFDRKPGEPPRLFPTANVPQAWAAASVISLLQTVLGFQPDVPRGALYLSPQMPEWLPDLTLKRLSLGGARPTIHFSGRGNQVASADLVLTIYRK